jgi:uncharacterized protein YcfJ
MHVKHGTARLLLATLCLAGPIGCATKAQNGALIGAGIGALAGGAIGQNNGGNNRTGALVGAGAGALGGYLVGNAMDESDERQRQEQYRRDRAYANDPYSHRNGYR